MDFEKLSAEVKEKAIACKSADELIQLAKEEGIELSDDQLESIAGGDWKDPCENYVGKCMQDGLC